MILTGNTILITGGGSGIGRGLAEAFHALGNKVIIAGRRQNVLDHTTEANPGMASAVLDIEDPAAIRAFAAKITGQHPALNVLINNAGILKPENLKSQEKFQAMPRPWSRLIYLARFASLAALLPHLQKQPRAAILNVSSGLGFVPLPFAPTYSATKAALHSYTQSLRVQLRDTPVQVIEIIPPYVQTELGGSHQASDSRAMPLEEYIAETIQILKSQPEAPENCVERVKFLRFAEATGTFEKAFQMLTEMSFE